MGALLQVQAGMDPEYLEFVGDAIKLTSVYFVALFLHCTIHPKPAKLLEAYAVEIYALLMLGLLAYHLVVKRVVAFV